MVMKSSSKKKLSIALVVIFMALILTGVGIGVYFFVKDKSGENGLSKNQIAFGTTIKNYNKFPSSSLANFNGSYDGAMQDVVDFSSNYIAYKSDSQTYFVSTLKKQPFVIDVDFDEVVSVAYNVALLKVGDKTIVYDLENKTHISLFKNASISLSNKFLFVRVASSETFSVKFSGETLNVSSAIIDTVSGNVVFKTTFEDDVIDVSFGKYFAVVVSKEQTKAFSLSENFKEVLSFQNIGQESSDSFNIKSSISEKTFVMADLYRASELSSRSLLIERTVPALESDGTVSGIFNGREVFYKIEYNIFDAKTNSYAYLNSDNCLIEPASCDFAESYVAIIKSQIKNKKIDSSERTIEYYYLLTNEISKNKLQTEKLISYDYDKYGLVVGYDKGKLFTSGGSASSVIGFNGEQTSCISQSAGEKVESTSSDNSVVVYSSVSGMKGVKLASGEVLFKAEFDKISLLSGKNMIAKKGGRYFVLDTDKSVSEISSFAKEFENYVFSGIGYYFTKVSGGKYNVYKIDKTAYMSNVAVRFVESFGNLKLYVGNQIVSFSLPSGIVGENIEIKKSDISFSFVKNFANVKTALAGSENLEKSEINVDQTTGAGFATYEKSLSQSDLEGLEFASYDELSSELKSLIPAFDDALARSYVLGGEADGENVSFAFDGASFLSDDNVAIVIIRLKNQTTNEYSLMVSVALKNAYLKEFNFTSASELVFFDSEGKHEANITYNKTVAGTSLTSSVGLYDETAPNLSRTVDYGNAGYDGGMVFVSNDATSLNFRIVVSNIYVSENEKTELYEFDGLTDGETIDVGNFVITVIKSEAEKKILVSAKNGYAFKGLSAIVTNNSSIVGDSDKTVVSTLNEYAISFTIDFSSFSERYFKLENISMCEWFARLTLKDFEGSEQEDQVAYYFYGYQDNVSTERNPAPFGFVDFERKISVNAFAKEGYDFNGFDFESGGTVSRVINSTGRFIASNILLVSDLTVKDIVLNASYSAKTYHIKYRNGGTILLEDKAVLFDSEIGTLLTADEIDVPAGYNFTGWTYNGNVISETLKYTFARDIIVDAKYEAKTYVLKFDANTDTYSSVNIKGFDFNINSVLFAEDFEGYYASDKFEGEISKSITFGQKFGALPKLNAYYSVSGENQETYVFVGWFSEKEFVLNGENISRGTQYSENDLVSNDPPIQTLYAHYEKRVYRVDVVDENQDLVENSGALVPHFTRLIYSGSSKTGVKNNFSTSNESGYELLTKINNIYNLYTVSDANLSLQMFVGDGYYVSKITVEIYNQSNTETYTFVGTMNGETYVLSGLAPSNLTANSTGRNVVLNFSKLLTSKTDNGENLGAKVNVQTSAIYFDNTFVLSGTELKVSRDNVFNISGNGTDNNLIYNSKNVYKISPFAKTSSVGTFNLAVLKKFVINGTTLEFGHEYKQWGGAYFNVVSATNVTADSVIKDNNVVKTTYFLGNATLVLSYDISSKTYSYELSILQLEDNQIEILTEDVSSSVQLNFTNTSTDSLKKEGMTASLESYVGGQSGSTSNIASGYNLSGVLPTDKLEFSLKLSNYFIMSETALVLNYGDGSYNIYRFVINNINTSSKTIAQSFSVVAPEMFNSSSSGLLMDGTEISFAYDSSSKTFSIVVAGIYKDVSVSLQYYGYKFISIYSNAETSYSATIQDGTFNQKTLREIAEESSADVRQVTEIGASHFVIFKNESNISKIKVSTKTTDSELYQITSASGDVTRLEGNTIANVVIGERNYRTSLTIEKIDRTINLTSYLGQNKNGEDFSYEKDPLSGFDLLADMSISYYNALGNLTEYKLQSPSKNVVFNGTKIIITFANIKNYTLKTAGLYNLETGNFVSDGLVTNVLEDGTNQYIYSLNSDAGKSFEFRTYFDPYSFVVKYDIEGNVKDVASSSISNSQSDLAKFENQVAYWNAPYQIVNVSLARNGYDFLGFSLELSDQSTYAPGQIVTNFEVTQDQMENGKEIILYAVYSAKKFAVSFVRRNYTSTNDYIYGSTSVVISGSSSGEVTFDQCFTLKEAYRIGYNFTGWYSGISGTKENNEVAGTVITAETKLDDNLLNSLNKDASGRLCLYAGWSAIRFTISFNRNDNTESNGSTSSVGDISEISVLFDSEKIPTLPTLTRYGYVLSGFKAQQLMAGETNEYTFVEAGNILNSLYLNRCGINIRSQKTPVSEFTLYAVWTAKTFRAVLDTQKSTLSGQGDGDPDISLNVTDGYSGIDNGNYYVDVKFDSQFKIVPNISATGYNFNGVFTEPTAGTKILATTVVDSSFDEIFTIYAQYSKLSYNIDIGSGDLENCTPSGTIIKQFYDTLEIAMQTKPGYFIKTIVIYSLKETITITYSWDSENKTMVLQSVSSSVNESLSRLNSRTTLYKNIQTTYSYNEQASGDKEARSCLLNLTINGIKDGFKVEVQNTSVQTFALSFYTFAEGDYGQTVYKEKYNVLNFDISAGGFVVCQEELLSSLQNYPYLPGYKFVEYRYGIVENGEVVPDITENGEIPVSRDETHVALENRKIVAVYSDQTRQGVHFYFYTDGRYAERSESEFMMYWKDGSSWKGNSSKFDLNSFLSENIMNVGGGKILELPSTGSFLWPDGKVLCGFVISSSTPASGYYNLENSRSLKQFDCSTKIEEEINVYAVYDDQYFTISNTGTTLKSDYSLYQEYNGAYIKVNGDIKYLKMSEADYLNYKDQISRGQTAEVALTMVSTEEVSNCATNGYYVAVIMSDSGVYYKVSDNALKIG